MIMTSLWRHIAIVTHVHVVHVRVGVHRYACMYVHIDIAIDLVRAR